MSFPGYNQGPIETNLKDSEVFNDAMGFPGYNQGPIETNMTLSTGCGSTIPLQTSFDTAFITNICER